MFNDNLEIEGDMREDVDNEGLRFDLKTHAAAVPLAWIVLNYWNRTPEWVYSLLMFTN